MYPGFAQRYKIDMKHEAYATLCTVEYIAMYALSVTPKLVDLPDLRLAALSSRAHLWLFQEVERVWEREAVSSHQVSFPVRRIRRGKIIEKEEIREAITEGLVKFRSDTIDAVENLVFNSRIHKGDHANPIDMDAEKPLELIPSTDWRPLQLC